MALSALDARVGTIVDWTIEVREDRKRIDRPIIKRGLIIKVDGEGSDSIGGETPGQVLVKFDPSGEPEMVKMSELVRVFPYTHRLAREAYRRIMGIPKNVGQTFQARKGPARARVQDQLALTKRPSFDGFVKPEEGSEEDVGGMPLADTGA